MKERRDWWVVILAAWVLLPLGCHTSKGKVEVSQNMKREIAALRVEKLLIDDKLRDIENARALLEQRNRDDLENIRRAIESIQSASLKIQTRLDTMETVEPTTPVPPKRLPPVTAAILIVVFIFCVLMALKMRKAWVREKHRLAPEEAPVDSSTGSSQSGTPT